MVRQIGSIQLLFLVPGLLLVGASLYIPADYAYKQLFWPRTEARFLEQILPENELNMGYSLLEFADASGTLYQVKENDENTMITGSDDQHFILYYNPIDPTDYVMMNPGRYLLLLFFPFGVLLCFLGWPERKITSQKKPYLK
jgi:hypothetical protein